MNDDGLIWLLFATPAMVGIAGFVVFVITGWQDRRDRTRGR